MFTEENIYLYIKTLSIILSTYYCFLKIGNIKIITFLKTTLTVSLCFTQAIAFIIMRVYLPVALILCILLFFSCFYFYIISNSKFDFSITNMLFSFGLSMIIYIIALFINGIVYKSLLGDNRNYNYYLLLMFTQLLISYYFFTIKRFKNGFPFLIKRDISIYSILFVGIVLICSNYIANTNNDMFTLSFLIGIILCGIVTIRVIRKGISMHYKNKMKDHTIELLEEEIHEKDQLIDKLNAENAILAKANHKISKRFATMERIVFSLSVNAVEGNQEFTADFSGILEEIKKMAEEYQKELQYIPQKKLLPSTNIFFIDSMFEHFQTECLKKNIEFNLKVNGSIPYMVEKIIAQNKLETLIGDHIQDAMIAIDAEDKTFRSICYHWCCIRLLRIDNI